MGQKPILAHGVGLTRSILRALAIGLPSTKLRAAVAVGLLILAVAPALLTYHVLARGVPVGNAVTVTSTQSNAVTVTSAHAVAQADANSSPVVVRRNGCGCLNWKDVYTTRGITCGQGHELEVLGIKKGRGIKTVPRNMYEEFCTNFFMKADFTSCFNVKFGSPARPWCYVEAECEKQQQVKGKTVALHWCSAANGDSLLNGTRPGALTKLAASLHLEMGLFGKMSYAMDTRYKWSNVQAAANVPKDKAHLTRVMDLYFRVNKTPPTEISPAAREHLNEVIASGIPTVFDSDSRHGGGTLVIGPKVFAYLKTYTCIKDCDR